VLLCVLLLAAPLAVSAPRLVGDLPRAGNRPLESLPGVETEYSDLRVADGVRLRTIVTRPHGAQGPLPAVLFVQWLSCDSIEIRPDARDGWSALLRQLITGSGVLWQRVDKAGVGDSEGPACSALDYETELAHHRAAFRQLLSRPDVDPERVVIFGASMGSNFAPLIAADQNVAGVVVWGGGTTTWYERMLRFERNALELGDTDPASLAAEVSARAVFFTRYLLEGQSPATIASRDPEFKDVWSKLVGTSGDTHYGRPVEFHQQAQQQNWAGAWARVRSPVLVLYGEFDWYESRDAAALIVDIVNRKHPGAATLRVMPGLDHHFMRYATRRDAFKESGGVVAAEPAVEAILAWLAQSDLRRP
jgi:pimeloyl-ACP methyl ester carboxylesterase